MLHDQSREFGALAQHRDVLQALAAPTSVESHKHSSLLCEWDMSLSLKIDLVDLVHCSNSSVRGSLQAQPDECFAMCQNLHILDLRIPTAVEIKSTEKSSTWLGGNGEQRQRTTAFQSLPLCTHRTAGSLLTGCDEGGKRREEICGLLFDVQSAPREPSTSRAKLTSRSTHLAVVLAWLFRVSIKGCIGVIREHVDVQYGVTCS